MLCGGTGPGSSGTKPIRRASEMGAARGEKFLSRTAGAGLGLGRGRNHLVRSSSWVTRRRGRGLLRAQAALRAATRVSRGGVSSWEDARLRASHLRLSERGRHLRCGAARAAVDRRLQKINLSSFWTDLVVCIGEQRGCILKDESLENRLSCQFQAEGNIVFQTVQSWGGSGSGGSFQPITAILLSSCTLALHARQLDVRLQLDYVSASQLVVCIGEQRGCILKDESLENRLSCQFQAEGNIVFQTVQSWGGSGSGGSFQPITAILLSSCTLALHARQLDVRLQLDYVSASQGCVVIIGSRSRIV
ncbi:uncharacterized protein [Vicugna pacos]|uniref:Uncharacterized protein n=1 Tax=Vicugna pacos TaxID=30538 RepID=A0ABM5CC29_VICPA